MHRQSAAVDIIRFLAQQVKQLCIDPVSYTHLDVYKRQMSDKCPPFVRGGGKALFASLAARFRSASVEDCPCLLYTSRCV